MGYVLSEHSMLANTQVLSEHSMLANTQCGVCALWELYVAHKNFSIPNFSPPNTLWSQCGHYTVPQICGLTLQ